MTKEKYEEYKKLFKEECTERSDSIDPDDEHCWLSLTIGWAIAKGMEPEDAIEFAGDIRYGTDLA